MPKKENLINKKFNRLLVIEEAPSRNKKTYWKCKCECGTILEVRADTLKSGKTKSCGCLNTETRSALGKSRFQDISQQRFGKLTAIKPTQRITMSKGYYWLCECDCGNNIEVCISDLKNGNTTSCGCNKESLGEKNIGLFLLSNSIKFETQKQFSNLKSKSNRSLKFDFFLPEQNILIEFDGPQHYTINSNNRYSSQNLYANDQLKNKFCLEQSIPLYRIPYSEKFNILNYTTLNELCKPEFLVDKIDFYNLGNFI